MGKNIKQPEMFPITRDELAALFPFTNELVEQYQDKDQEWQNKLMALYTGEISFPIKGASQMAQVSDAIETQEILAYYNKKCLVYLEEMRKKG